MSRLLLVFLLAFTPAFAALDRAAQIDATGIVETGGRARTGAHFERGVYQMLPSVCAVVGGDDRAAALRWLDRVIRQLEDHHIDVNPMNCSLVWNAGIGAVLRGQVPMSSYAYSLRVSALYSSILATRSAPPKKLAPPHRFVLIEQPFTVNLHP